jgi:hypothetical protein
MRALPFLLLIGYRAPEAPSISCDGPAAHRLDFWLGEWEVRDPAGRLEGRNVVTRALRGCAIEERWTDAGGSKGESLFWLDPATRLWRQTWVTESGTTKEKIEKAGGAAIVFEGERDRTILTPIAGGVSQVIETRAGQRWEGIYRRAATCDGAREHDLDFWIGDWDATIRTEKEETHGRNVITKTLGGCAVEERFEAGGWHGTSVSRWVEAEAKWRQVWVDDEGSWLLFTGGRDPEGFVLTAEPRIKDGVTSQMRMVFRNITQRSFVWRWERTRDGGASWVAEMTITYARAE